MFPVDELPKVRDCALVVDNVPVALRYAPPRVPERVAVGVPPATLMMANLADDVDCPPMRRSTVELLANSAPWFWFQKASSAPWVDVMVIAPAPLAIDIPEPAVRFASVNPFVPSLPMRSCPSVTVEVLSPVPPLAVGKIDVPTVFACERSSDPNATVPEPFDLNTSLFPAVVNEGTPEPFVINAALFAVLSAANVSAVVV